MNDISEMVTVITGASSEIGKVFALKFANRGATVVPAAGDETTLLEFENETDAVISIKNRYCRQHIMRTSIFDVETLIH